TAILIICRTGTASAQQRPDFYGHGKDAWVDSVFNALTPDQRLAQLFMVAAYSNRDEKHLLQLDTLVNQYGIGGLIYFQGGPVRQAWHCNHLQSRAKVPMLIAMDAEWGLGMRLDSTISYPRQMTLGAIADDRAVERFGEEVARQMTRLGMHINFAPVVDVNSNPNNPVIGTRSFGEDKRNVGNKGVAYAKGMQKHRVLACAKHFPGHGDTDTDSHHTLPIIRHSYARIDSLELYPFKQLIANGVGSMMVAHLDIPALDTVQNRASTLSPEIVTGLLKDSLGFEGITFTDALNMKGVSSFYRPGEVDLLALLAGNDVMLFAENVPRAMDEICHAVAIGRITQEEIDARCRKLLHLKAWAGLDRYRPIELKGLYGDLKDGRAKAMMNEVVAASLTLLTNRDSIVPIRGLSDQRIASLVVGDAGGTVFQHTLSRYAPIDHFTLQKNYADSEAVAIIDTLAGYDRVIVSLHGLTAKRSDKYGVTDGLLNLINAVASQSRTVVNVFGNPYALSLMPGLENADAVLFSFENSDVSQHCAAQAIFGGIAVSGTLPVTANRIFPLGMGVRTAKIRMAYGLPEQAGLSAKGLERIAPIVQRAMAEKAMPGAQVLVARNGMVVYEQTFGTHTYEGKRAVEWNDLYDLASITKVAASLASFMTLVDDGKVKVDDKVSAHLTQLKFTNKKDINFRDMLAHSARLKAWVPFYNLTMRKGQPDSVYYRKEQSDAFPLRVAENLFMRKDYPDTVRRMIDDSDLLPTREYKYSDLGYFYIRDIIEQKTGMGLDAYAAKKFYARLGLQHLGYHPRRRFPLDRIVPTEYDMTFRKQLVHGDVHDPSAAMFGGVGGHAGLFSNANDLAVMMQMFLNKGVYGGERFIKAATVDEFIRCQFCKEGNRRGIGFDRPVSDGKGGPTCDCVSYLSFGHTGFTGTMAWADPESGIVYIFLSNRVYPDAENNKLLKMNVRTDVQQVIYDAIVR
ncbi:MAG: serine hydrolase, partial [Flavobacteriales bacterium]|nr:serine hydrolase [Flavobacteriales bacterium]